MKKCVETALRFEYFVLLDEINAECINNNTHKYNGECTIAVCMLFTSEECSSHI